MTEKKPLYMHIDVKPDENGVYDGRAISKRLMNLSYRLLATYADDDLPKAEQLFQAIAYETLFNNRIRLETPDEDDIEEFEDEEQETVKSRAMSMTIEFSDQAERQKAIDRHVEDTKGFTDGLLSYPVKW